MNQIDDLAILNWRFEPEGILEEVFVDLSYHKVQETLERIRRSNPTRLEESNFNVHTFGVRGRRAELQHMVTPDGRRRGLPHIVHTRSIDKNRTTGEYTNEDGRVQVPDWSSYTSLGVYAQNETTFFDEMLCNSGTAFVSRRSVLCPTWTRTTEIDG